ncbi:MAG: transposase [Planctomycetes bacterium]|nr:transposase [Planctomycetota bacterium]
MPVTIIGKDAPLGPGISWALQQVTLNSVRKVLLDAAIDRAASHAAHTYRSRILNPVVTVLHMILASLWPEESFQASAHLLWDNLTGAFPGLRRKSPSSGSMAKARARLPLKLWDHINRFLADKIQELSKPWAAWRGHRVVLVDGTCVSMPDTPALHKCFGASTGRGGKRHYPLARMVTLSLANTMSVLSYAMGRYRQSEQNLLRPLLKGLRTGDLLIADRHFAGANLYAEYLANSLNFLTRAHQMLNISQLRRIKGYGSENFATDSLSSQGSHAANISAGAADTC